MNAVLDNHLHLPIEEESDATESSNIIHRVSRLARRILHAVKSRTSENLIQPAQNQLKNLTEQLQKSLHLVSIINLIGLFLVYPRLSYSFKCLFLSSLNISSILPLQVDILKQQRNHLQSSVSDIKTKFSNGQLSDSLKEVFERIQAEAKEYKISPDEALIRSIKRCSFVLDDYLKKLRQQTNEVF